MGAITRNDDQFTRLKGSLQQEDITLVNSIQEHPNILQTFCMISRERLTAIQLQQRTSMGNYSRQKNQQGKSNPKRHTRSDVIN